MNALYVTTAIIFLIANVFSHALMAATPIWFICLAGDSEDYRDFDIYYSLFYKINGSAVEAEFAPDDGKDGESTGNILLVLSKICGMTSFFAFLMFTPSLKGQFWDIGYAKRLMLHMGKY